MADGFHADPGVIAGISRTLGNASDDLGEIGKSTPGTPNAGEATPAITAILGLFADNAHEMVLGLAAASEAVHDAKKNYVARDTAASEELAGIRAEGSPAQ